MSLLPSFATESVTGAASVQMPIEYGIDFSTGQMTGKKVYGLEAIKVWIWLCVHTERFRYQIYSWDYGVELEQYIGQTITEDFLNMDCRDGLEEALTIHPCITGIDGFEAYIERDRVRMKFTAVTTLGEVEMDV